jgi:hypothetical protein
VGGGCRLLNFFLQKEERSEKAPPPPFIVFFGPRVYQILCNVKFKAQEYGGRSVLLPLLLNNHNHHTRSPNNKDELLHLPLR